jgi:mRNA interferase MazF
MNNKLNTVIIAALTSTIKVYPTRVNVVFNKKKGQIALDHIRFIDKFRLSNKLICLNQKLVML